MSHETATDCQRLHDVRTGYCYNSFLVMHACYGSEAYGVAGKQSLADHQEERSNRAFMLSMKYR